MIRLLAFYCVCSSVIHLVRAQTSTCATPHGERGSCIPLQRCPSLYNLFSSSPGRVQLYQCGHSNNPQNPFVCCPQSTEMNQQSGNQRPGYDQPSTYDPSYRPSSSGQFGSGSNGQFGGNSVGSGHNRPSNDQTTYRPSPSGGQFGSGSSGQFGDNGGGSSHNRPSNDQTTYRPSPSGGQSGHQWPSPYDQSPYRPSLASFDQSPYRPSSSSSPYDQSSYRPTSSSYDQYRPSQSDYTTPSSHRPSYDQSNNQHRPYDQTTPSQYDRPSRRPGIHSRQRFTEADLPTTGRCGTQAKDRIIGGEETSIVDYPWMALIHYSKRGRGGGFFCGGALIHENYVITAAHCIKGATLVKAGYTADSVRLGEHDLRSTTDCEEGECADPVQNIDVADTIVHEQYDGESDSQANDIALIRLARPAPYTDFIRPVCLPIARHLRNKNFDEQPLVVAGFGKTENASRSDVKLKLEISGFNSERCNQIYQRYLRLTLTPKQLCAGGEEGRDSCSGDSGGPLMGEDHTNSLNPYSYLAGVVSLGPTKCGSAGYPGVYTRTDQYIDWILNHMEK